MIGVHDVVVIGGGPAGAAVARGLALRGRDVVLLEASAFGGPRFGETLPPEANPLLRALGVWDAFAASNAIESPGTISAWGSAIPSETDFIGNVNGNGYHVDRNAFDALLCRAAADAGVDVRTPVRVVRCSRDDGESETGGDDGTDERGRAGEGVWRVTTGDGSELRARFAIDASGRNGVRLDVDGRNSLRLDAGGRRIVDDALVGVFVRVAHESGAPTDLRTLVESVPDGWWYCAPLPSGETVAVFLTDPALYASDGVSLGEQFEDAPLTRARIGAARIVASHVVHVPSSARACAAGDDWAAVGDAAAAYDPLSGYGITKALADARDLAEAAHTALDGDRTLMRGYAERVRRAFDAYAVQRRAYYALERRWPDRAFWKNRLTPRPIPSPHPPDAAADRPDVTAYPPDTIADQPEAIVRTRSTISSA